MYCVLGTNCHMEINYTWHEERKYQWQEELEYSKCFCSVQITDQHPGGVDPCFGWGGGGGGAICVLRSVKSQLHLNEF